MRKSAPAKDLILILTGIGYQESYIRITLSQMKRRGELITPQRGDYQLTTQDQTYVTELEKKVKSINADQVMYTLVLTGFHADHAVVRQQTANLLHRLGFGNMGNGVYVGIGDKRSVREALTLDDQDSVKVVLTSAITPTPTAEEISQWWDLERVTEQIQALAHQLDQLMGQGDLATFDNLTLLQRYLQLIDLVGAYYASDPMLPKVLVGSDWLGYWVLRRMLTYGQQIVASVDKTGPFHDYFDFGVLTR
ncbi:MAG TPA: hypothetical protein H9875_00535 [Candidatus Levilactobacillus faecigallinarum]|uniref:Transcriptional repressor PaaX-like N-terminal domain-containing protein n=1 Tax=Candidatus Levilactobacillus faecigallinarum TaxID=2838638 RepID=A0A9D1QR54_9LACO|nr:hypothetical protein [Candidatus Levilactobacillus faecigallinarum]